jgi:hypothetical protein
MTAAPTHTHVPVRRCACGGTVGPSGECAACWQKRLRREAQAPPPVQEVVRSPGRPLEPGVQARMESRFGHDFSRVRVHTDAPAAASARALAAGAYTVGEHVAFAAGRYRPETPGGERLLAHELAHVRQQAGATPRLMPRLLVDAGGSPLEREAEAAAEAVAAGRTPCVEGRSEGLRVQRHPDDLVAYTGGQRGRLAVFKAGSLVYTGPAVSGHPGSSEWEENVGPTPTGMYHIHPGITQAPVTKVQEHGVCGARLTALGYQEITSEETRECEEGSHHYCNVPCPTATNPRQRCWTPRDCWGPMRIRIEGGADVLNPKTGVTVPRGGFYLHGGNPLDPVSSGCVKTMDNSVFSVLRDPKLTGTGRRVCPLVCRPRLRLCVGSACPPFVTTALAAAPAARLPATVAAVMHEAMHAAVRGSE